MAFVKALLAAAWADGDLTSREIKTITEYLRRFEISAAEYQELKPLLEAPLEADVAQSMLEEQLAILATAEEQNTLLAAIKDLLVVEEELHPDATQFLDGLRGMIDQPSTPQLFVSRLRALWALSPPPSPAKKASGTTLSVVANFFQKRLLEYYRRQIAVKRAKAGLDVSQQIPARDLYRTVIWAALLSRVADADSDFCPAEQSELVNLLKVASDLPEGDLEVVAETYGESGLSNLDLSILVREFSEFASQDDFTRLLEGLFAVAAADGKLLDSEVAVIRQITLRAGFSEHALVDAYQRCRKRMSDGVN